MVGLLVLPSVQPAVHIIVMAFASVRSATLFGVQGCPVDIEIHVGMGLPGFTIVGQPDEACRESRDRVRAALLSCDLPWPNKRITVNLATAVHERKGGAGLDAAIAIGLLVVQEVIPAEAIAMRSACWRPRVRGATPRAT